jgi:hypothetical protein
LVRPSKEAAELLKRALQKLVLLDSQLKGGESTVIRPSSRLEVATRRARRRSAPTLSCCCEGTTHRIDLLAQVLGDVKVQEHRFENAAKRCKHADTTDAVKWGIDFHETTGVDAKGLQTIRCEPQPRDSKECMCRQARGTNVAEQVFGESNNTVFSEVLGADHAKALTFHHFLRYNIKRRRALRPDHYRKERNWTHYK